jgi:hypothetical protein
MLFVHLDTFTCVSLVFSAHTSAQLRLSLYTALFDTLFLVVLALLFNELLMITATVTVTVTVTVIGHAWPLR